MLRWLVRLIILGAIVGVGAFVASRLLNREEEWDDFDDMDESFDFQETPVEIEVPAQDGGQARFGGGGASMAMGGGEESGPGLIDVKGIGNAFEARLKAIGINTLQDLANAAPESLNEQLDVPGGVATLEAWISQAKEMTSGGQSSSNGSSGQ